MKAIVFKRYGPPDVLQFTDLEAPRPAPDEVLVRVYAGSLNPLDFHQMRGHVRPMTGWRKPRNEVFGNDLSGQVEAVGRDVKRLRPGDDVFGVKGLGGGAFAEYVCAPERKLAPKPSNISFEEAAAVPIAALTALQGLRDKGGIRAGQKVAIDGASGGVGTFAIQIAKSFGTEVTAICSTRNLAIAKDIGADHVIDYTQQNFTQRAEQYDLIFGANAFHSVLDYLRVLKRGGTCVLAGGGRNPLGALIPLSLGPFLPMFVSKRVRIFIAKMNAKDLEFLADLMQAGKLRPVIDRRYPLEQAAEAVRYLEQGHAQGKVVLTLEPMARPGAASTD